MTYEEFQRQIGKAGLSVRGFADLVGMNKNSVTNYAKRGMVPSHLAIIATLMGELAEHSIDFKGSIAKINVELKKPRGGAAKGKFGGSPQQPLVLSQINQNGAGNES